MKKIIATLAVCLLVAPALAGWTSADGEFNISRENSFFAANGGEFTMSVDNATVSPITGLFSDTATGTLHASSPTWQTFCLEYSETVVVPGTHYGVVTTFATGGGVSGQDGTLGPNGSGSDSLSPETAWLYTQFRNGTLTGYNYGANRDDSAKALQQAIWHLEGERTLGQINATAQSWVTLAQNSGATDIGNVRVLTLWGKYGNGSVNFNDPLQDQLMIVPAPAAGLLGLLGLGGLGWVRRRLA